MRQFIYKQTKTGDIYTYWNEMNGKCLEEVIEERDLGVIIQSDLKCSQQCLKAVSTANKVFGMIKRSFSIRDKEIILQLYMSLVRPHLEYSIQIMVASLSKRYRSY